MARGRRAVDRVEKVVRTLFSAGRAEAKDDALNATGADETPRGAAGSTVHDLHDALTERLARSRLLAVGRVQILGLDRVRERLGHHWEQVAEDVHRVVQSVLQERLASVDVSMRLGEAAYVLAFGELSKEEAQVKCAAISDEIWRRLVGGTIAPEQIDVRTVVTDIDHGVAIERTNFLEVLNSLLDHAEVAAARGRTADVPAQWRRVAPLGPSDRDISTDLTGDLSSPLPVSRSGSHAERTGTRSFDDRGGGAGELDDIDMLPAAQPGVAHRLVGEELIAEYGIEFRYRPLWDVRRKVLSTYVCTPVKGGQHGALIGGHALLDSDDDAKIARLDLLVLSRVWQDLITLDGQGLRVLLACPVHYRTLVRGAAAQRYRLLCQMVPEQLRRYIIFEIVGLQPGAPRSLIQDVAFSLWSSGRSIIAQLDGKHPFFEGCRGSRLHAVGLEIDRREASEADIMSMLDRFAAGAHEANLRAYAHGVSSLSLATAAVCAGFDYIDGDAVHEPVRFPQYIYRFRSQDLLNGFLRQERPGRAKVRRSRSRWH